MTCVKEGRFTFGIIRDWFGSVWSAMVSNSDLSSIWQGLLNAVAPIKAIFFTLLIVCCLCVAFFGRKIMGAVKFSAFLLAGFCTGVHFIAPLLPSQIAIPSWIIGLVIALIAAVLSRFLYVILYFVFFGYGTYSFILYLFLLNPAEAYTDTKAIVCLIVAALITVLAFVFRRFVEMAVTSLLGAWAATGLVVKFIYDFSAWSLFGGNDWLGIIIFASLISMLSFFVQFITRRRY
ncbi:MAG: hypothetical protein E7612_02405 [Ruminococcaceae bacterium]|nr:hypothetical protein [Oscillospiraceae bacterium]